MWEMNFYINFKEDTGEIWKVTNSFDNSTPSIEIEGDEYKLWSSGTKKMKDYTVVPVVNGNDVKYEIKTKHKDFSAFDVDNSIHRLAKVAEYNDNNAVLIMQNNNNWVVYLTEGMQRLLSSTSYYKEQVIRFYITEENNPNILLDTLEIPMWKILYGERYVVEDYKKEVAQRSDISVYCAKVFENYIHIVEPK